jgi:hypothetical protein
MDKTLAQLMIVVIMLTLVSAATMAYTVYMTSDTPQSNAEAGLYAKNAASLFYADISRLYVDSANRTMFLMIPPQQVAPNNWVCINLLYTQKYGTILSSCGDMRVAVTDDNVTVTRSFKESFWNGYAVMTYVPEGSSYNLTFNWWLSANQWAGWIWFGAFLVKGDAVSSGSFSVIETAPFYWTEDFWGGTRSGTYSGLTVPGGYTLAVLVEIIPGPYAHITYGFTVAQDTQNTVKVFLPTHNYSVTLVSGGNQYGTKPGPTATFHLTGKKVDATLKVYYDYTMVAQISTILEAGEEIVFYVDPNYGGPPQELLALNQPVRLSVTNNAFTLSYGDVNVVVHVDVSLLGGGVSNSWLIMLVGCQKTCVVLLEPASQPMI